MKLSFIGSGYVGLTTGACFSSLGHSVICQDIDEKKIALLKQGIIPIFEPSLENLVKKGIEEGNLKFTTDTKNAVEEADCIFICVNTPARPDGHVDLRYIEKAAREISRYLNGYKIIIDKSTVPVRTAKKVKETIVRHKKNSHSFDVVSNPEFLREGNAVNDILFPDRIVIGVESEKAKKIMLELYKTLIKDKDIPVKITSVKSAELIKHGANTFLSAKISFANLIAQACEASGADALEVLDAIGLDKRIGKDFLKPGIGFGGSCFPKDISAFKKTLEVLNIDSSFIKAVEDINTNAYARFLKKLEKVMWVLDGKKITMFGLSFKPDTDDIRNSPAIKILEYLKSSGAKISVHDPKAMDKVKNMHPDIEFCDDPYKAAESSDGVILCTEWDIYKNLDYKKIYSLMQTPVIFDGRNALKDLNLRAIGFEYYGVGR